MLFFKKKKKKKCIGYTANHATGTPTILDDSGLRRIHHKVVFPDDLDEYTQHFYHSSLGN